MLLGLDQLLSNVGSDGNGEQKVRTVLHPDHVVTQTTAGLARAVQVSVTGGYQ